MPASPSRSDPSSQLPALWLATAVAALTGFSGIAAAESAHEVWPELDAYFPINERLRAFVMASSKRSEDSALKDGEWRRSSSQVGAHLDMTLKPRLRPGLVAGDWERERYLWMRVGYRYVGNYPGDDEDYHEDRGILELSASQPLGDGFALTGRTRWEMRNIDGRYSNRYRFRAEIEKTVQVGSRPVAPYVNAEFFYDTRYDAWNRQRYQIGVDVPLSPKWKIEPYLAYQTDSRSEPGDLAAFGLTLKYYY